MYNKLASDYPWVVNSAVNSDDWSCCVPTTFPKSYLNVSLSASMCDSM